MKKLESRRGHEEAVAEVRRIVGEAQDLSGAAKGALTDNLAAWFAGRYAIATRDLLGEGAGGGGVDLHLLRDLCHDVVVLRRGDHSAEWLRIERERLGMAQMEQKEALERLFREWAKENRFEVCGKRLTPEEKEDGMRRILGMEPIQRGPKKTEGEDGGPAEAWKKEGEDGG